MCAPVFAVAAPPAAADSSAVDVKPLAMKAYGIRSVERKGDRTLVVSLVCEARGASGEKPSVRVKSTKPIAVVVE